MKIRLVGAEFYADGRTDGRTDIVRRTDMTKLIVGFCNLANPPKYQSVNLVYGKSRSVVWDTYTAYKRNLRTM